jgi:hypothetical protein
VYISDCEDDRIRKLTASNGIITTIAGGGTDYDDDRGDNGAATSATLIYPNGIALDSSGWHNYVYRMSLSYTLFLCL